MTGEDRRERRSVRLTLREAAEKMGISKDAVRQRIRRGTLQADKGEDGRVYVYVDTSTVRGVHPPGANLDDRADVAPLADELRDRIRYLERQVEEERDARRRADTLLAQLMQRIPELEASEAPEAPQSSETAPERQPGTGASPEPQEGVQRPQERSWWRRVFRM